MSVRPGVVNEVLLTLAGDRPAAERIADVRALGATPDELRAAGDMLSRSAVDALIEAGTLTPRAAPSILSLTYADLRQLSARYLAAGYCLGWLVMTELAGQWPPGATLGDLLKVMPRERLDRIAAELRLAGLEI